MRNEEAKNWGQQKTKKPKMWKSTESQCTIVVIQFLKQLQKRHENQTKHYVNVNIVFFCP